MKFVVSILGLLFSVQSASSQSLNINYSPCENEVACARKFVVSVLPVHNSRASRTEEPEGSGIIVGNGQLIATANHVIGEASRVLIRTLSGQLIEAKISLRDESTDIALLQIKEQFLPVSFAKTPIIGGRSCALGNSFGLGISVSCGVISATQMTGLGFNRIEDFIQTDAAVNPGMSGGALVNVDGELVGMLSAIFTKKSDSNIGVNFAVSAALLSKVIQDFKTHGAIKSVPSGLYLRPSLQFGEVGLSGALVVRIKKESSEKRAGVLAGDILLFAGNRRIKRAGAYNAALALLKKGDSLVLKVLRNGKQEEITVQFN